MKTIGFIDYYIDEWHANNYPRLINEICKDTGMDFCVKYVWTEEDLPPHGGKSTDEWCIDHGCEKCETIEELCEKSDYILMLSPSNPEKHAKYAKKVLRYKKNTYIDKTFASDFSEAKEIFNIAEKYGTRIFSSSALRYADELDGFSEVKNIVTTGGGGNLPEYIIHQIEMAQKVLAEKPLAVKVEKQGIQYICSAVFGNEKKACMIYSPSMPFTACGETTAGHDIFRTINSDCFKNLMADILRFYETGEPSFDTSQTLDVMKLRTGIINGLDKLGEYVML